MQDDNPQLSRWFATRPDALYTFRKNIMTQEKKLNKYQITVYSTVTKLHTVQASSIEEAVECANDILSPMEFGDEGSDSHWDQTVIAVKELSQHRELTPEELAFVEAYGDAVAVAPRGEVVRFVTCDSEHRSSREFYDSMSEYYTSIADAHEVWYQAIQFAKGQNK
jgi:hypothetical protein